MGARQIQGWARAHSEGPLPIVCDGCFSNLRRSLCKPKPVASTINTLTGALYKVFCASPDPARKEMRQACLTISALEAFPRMDQYLYYLVLNLRPLSLVHHFFAVAIYGVGRFLIPFPSPKCLWIGARLISGASGIIFPFIKAEGVWQMFFPVTVPAYYRTLPVHLHGSN